MRANGIASKESLVTWYNSEGYRQTSASAYLHADVHERILQDAFAAFGGDGADSPLEVV